MPRVAAPPAVFPPVSVKAAAASGAEATLCRLAGGGSEAKGHSVAAAPEREPALNAGSDVSMPRRGGVN